MLQIIMPITTSCFHSDNDDDSSYSNNNTSKIIAGVQVLTPLPKDFIPGQFDVIISNCNNTGMEEDNNNQNNSLGKKHFRSIIRRHALQYCRATGNKLEQSMIISQIIMAVRERCTPITCGFIIKQQPGGRWYKVCDDLAREEVRTTLQEFLHSRIKRSMEAKRKEQQKQQHRQDHQEEEGQQHERRNKKQEQR